MIIIRKYLSVLYGWLRLLKEQFWNMARIKTHGLQYFIGKNVHFRVSTNGSLDVGRKTWIDANSYISATGVIKLGFNNYFNTNCKIVAMENITIGDNNLFGPNVIIVDHNHNFSDISKPICMQGYQSKPIKIGSDIWIGANVTICMGVEICDHVVVGANAVVTKSITEPGVYVGIPAKKIETE